MIVKTGCGTDGALHSTGPKLGPLALALDPGNRKPVRPVPAKPPGRGELGCSVHGMGVTSSDSCVTLYPSARIIVLAITSSVRKGWCYLYSCCLVQSRVTCDALMQWKRDVARWIT